MLRGAREEDDDDGDEKENKPKVYQPPTTVLDSDLTAGEVVLLVLEALLNNDKAGPDDKEATDKFKEAAFSKIVSRQLIAVLEILCLVVICL